MIILCEEENKGKINKTQEKRELSFNKQFSKRCRSRKQTQGGLQKGTMSLYLHKRKLKPGSQVTSTSAIQTNLHKILFDAFDKIPRIWTQAKPSKKAKRRWERSWLLRATLSERPKRKAMLCENLRGEESKHLFSSYHVPGLCQGVDKNWLVSLSQFTEEEIGAQLVTKQVKGRKLALSACLFII